MDLLTEPLEKNSFAPFGEVIEMDGAENFSINEGTTKRYHDLATVDVTDQDGRTLISIFRGQPWPQPLEIRMMERHPLGSQAFYPIQAHKYLIVVSNKKGLPTPKDLRAFQATGSQGVNYRKNIWHHPLLVLIPDHDFLVIDRGGRNENLEEHVFTENEEITRLKAL